jgi:hypothetical protein
MAASNLLVFLGIVFAALRLAALVKELQHTANETIKPSLEAVNRLANEATSLVAEVGGHAERVVRDGANTATEVTRHVRTTSGLITGALRRPAIVTDSIMAGVETGIARFLAPRARRNAGESLRKEP